MKRRFLSILLALCMTMWLAPTGAFASQEGSAKDMSSASALSVANESGSDDAPATEPAVDDSPVGEGESTGQVESTDADSQISGAQSEAAGQPDGSATEAADSSAQNAVQLASVDEPSSVPADGTHVHRICGDSSCTDASHAEIEWTAWDSSTSLPSASGSYYLTTDVTLSDTWNVWKSTDIKLCLNGHTIIGADGKDTIVLKRPEESSTILDITDCHEGDKVGKITHNKGATGRAIENIGTLTLWNGSITGNTGGGFFSGIAVNNYREFNMRGGTISDNDGSQSCYGTVYNEGTFNMSAGSITNNLMQSGGGVYNRESGKFNMSGGSITDNVCTWRAAGVYSAGTFNLSGNVTIAGNTDKNGLDATVYLDDYSTIKVDESFSATSSIGISADKFNYDAVLGSADTSAFISDDPNYALDPNGSNLKLVMYPDHSHAVCGESSCTDPSSHGSALTWTRWAYRTSLPSEAGSYSLERDVTLADTWVVAGDVELCLNGHTITGPDGKDAIKVEAGGSLVITDCQTGDKVGKITHSTGAKGRGIENYGTLALWNGSIQGNTAINSVSVISPGGGGVSNQGTFTMHGGQIVGNTAKNGGGVENLGYFSMSGGSITGNSTLEGGNGGGVYADEPIGLSGDVSIADNKSGSTDSNVYLEIPDDSSGSNPVTIEVPADSTLGSAAKVGITASSNVGNPVVVTGSTNTSVFTSDDDAYDLVSDGNGNLVLSAALPHDHCVCGEDGCTDSTHGGSLKWTKWKNATSLPAASGNYFLAADVTLSEEWNVNDDISINLCLNGHTITGANGQEVIRIPGGSRLTITDCKSGDATGEITHKSGETGQGIINAGTLVLWNGSITGNTAKNGGGVENEGTFAMYGGSITHNTANYGGGVYNNGIFNVSGEANISGNKLVDADDGAENNVYLPSGKTVAVDEGKSLFGEASIGITAANPQLGPTVVSGTASTTGFSSDDDGYALLDDGNGGLKLSMVSVDVSGVKLLNEAGGDAMSGEVVKSKVYDAKAVAYDAESTTVSQTVRDASLVYTWQEKSGDGYADIADNKAPKTVGEYQLVVTYERDGVAFGKAEVPFAIAAKELTVTATAQDKTYDGNTDATVIASLDMDAVVSGDEVVLDDTGVTASFDTKDIGENKPVILAGEYKLNGTAAGNYTLIQPSGLTANILAYDAAGTKEIQQSDTVVAKEAAGADGNKADTTDGTGSGKSQVPRTGDASVAAWPLAVLGIAALAVSIVSARRRRS